MKLSEIHANPDNPRVLRDEKFEKLKKSIQEFPQMMRLRPIVIDDTGMVLGGNMRLRVLQDIYGRNGDVPDEWVLRASELTDEQKRRFIITDNNSFGDWDLEMLKADWDLSKLEDWGCDFVVDFGNDDDFYKKLERGTDTEEYKEFVDKFEPKHTTDDCYTPKPIYDEVVKFVDERFGIENREIVRPFYPGGDYESFSYPENCIVIDNPPFSIYAKIVRFYLEKKIDFFLFGPALTIGVRGADCCYYCVNASIIYANGAIVATSFVTNLDKENRIVVVDGLQDRLENLNERNSKELKGKNYDSHIITYALFGKIADHHTSLTIPKSDCEYIKDEFIDGDVCIFGGGLILSERAAAERAAAERAAAERAAAERAAAERAAAERAAAEPVKLSQKGWEIVRKLSE